MPDVPSEGITLVVKKEKDTIIKRGGVMSEILEYNGIDLIKRFPEDPASPINAGTRLIVREQQSALLYKDGKLIDTYGPGMHTIEGDASPTEVYLVNQKIYSDLKWGLTNPLTLMDPERGIITLRVFGFYSFRISDPALFVRHFAAAVTTFTIESFQDITRENRNVFISDYLGKSLMTKGFREASGQIDTMSGDLKEIAVAQFIPLGIEIRDFMISSIEPVNDGGSQGEKSRDESALWRCNSCGFKENPPGVENCQKCGESKLTIVKEGAWDCPNCGTKRNRGPFKCCPNCGKPHGDDVEFYLPDDARVVDNDEELNKANLGPDWKCQYCGGDNRADFPFCTGCGSNREGAPLREVKEERIDEKPPREEEPPPPEPLRKSPLKSILIGCGCLSLFFIVIFTAFLMNLPKAQVATVSGLRWERSVDIESLRAVRDSAWESETPLGARILSRFRELHHNDRVQTGSVTKTRVVHDKVKTGTEKVKVGKKNMGNGYFKEIYEEKPIYKDVQRTETYQEPVYANVPVYRMKVTYEIDRWQALSKAQKNGDDKNALWPDVKPHHRERLGARKEAYYVFFTAPKGEKYTYRTENASEWQSFEMGKKYKVDVDKKGNVKKVEKQA
jgi:hypothetical protein